MQSCLPSEVEGSHLHSSLAEPLQFLLCACLGGCRFSSMPKLAYILCLLIIDLGRSMFSTRGCLMITSGRLCLFSERLSSSSNSDRKLNASLIWLIASICSSLSIDLVTITGSRFFVMSRTRLIVSLETTSMRFRIGTTCSWPKVTSTGCGASSSSPRLAISCCWRRVRESFCSSLGGHTSRRCSCSSCVSAAVAGTRVRQALLSKSIRSTSSIDAISYLISAMEKLFISFDWLIAFVNWQQFSKRNFRDCSISSLMFICTQRVQSILYAWNEVTPLWVIFGKLFLSRRLNSLNRYTFCRIFCLWNEKRRLVKKLTCKKLSPGCFFCVLVINWMRLNEKCWLLSKKLTGATNAVNDITYEWHKSDEIEMSRLNTWDFRQTLRDETLQAGHRRQFSSKTINKDILTLSINF